MPNLKAKTLHCTRKLFAPTALLGAVLLFSSCSPSPVPATAEPILPEPAAVTAAPVTPTPVPSTPAPNMPAALLENPCGGPPVLVPTPAADPGYTRLGPSTGLHVTGKIQLLDLATYRLRVTGLVEHPLELTYDQIRCLPKLQARPLLVCPGFFEDDATWAGTPIADVLDLVGVQTGAQRVEFVSADGYKTSLSLEKAFDRTNFLAYEWQGEPLPRLHGFPLRVVIPTAQGNQWTKWLVEMRVE